MVDVLSPVNWVDGYSGSQGFPGTPPVVSHNEIWDGSRYVVASSGHNLYFACPPTEQTTIQYTIYNTQFGDHVIRLYYGYGEWDFNEYGGFSTAPTSKVEASPATITAGAPYNTTVDGWVVTIELGSPLIINGFMFWSWGGYPQGRPYSLNDFQLSNPVSSAESAFWRNFQGQRELIL